VTLTWDSQDLYGKVEASWRWQRGDAAALGQPAMSSRGLLFDDRFVLHFAATQLHKRLAGKPNKPQR
jgi:hypothetical protein